MGGLSFKKRNSKISKLSPRLIFSHMTLHGIKSHREAGDAQRKEDESEKKGHHLTFFVVSMGS